MSSFITAVKEGPVKVRFSHILTGIEIYKNVTLAPGLIPHGITIGVSENSNKVPVWDLDHLKWMDIETSTIISWT
jgi:hypothetical protein